MLTLETIDLNGIESLYSLAKELNLNYVLSSKVNIWKLRNNNPMRKSYINNKIKFEEFDALAKLTVEMSKYLYPYIRNILQSRDDNDGNSNVWEDFKKRYLELLNERFNTKSMKVKNLLNPNTNDEILLKSLLTLALCTSERGCRNLKIFLLNI